MKRFESRFGSRFERREAQTPQAITDAMVLDQIGLNRHRAVYCGETDPVQTGMILDAHQARMAKQLRALLMVAYVGTLDEEDGPLLECIDCGKSFDPDSLPHGTMACPHCGNTDW